MTTDRAVKLGQKIAEAVFAGGPCPEGVLKGRITNQVADLLLKIDWRVMPEDQAKTEDAKLFDGQMGLEL